MDDKHTGGPWSIHATVNKETGHHNTLIGDDDWWVCGIYPGIGVDDETDAANARLIAAAPALLEALRLVVDHDGELTGGDWAAIRAAINLATTGEEP